MSSLPAGDDATTQRLRAVMADVDDDLAHLRALRDAGTPGDLAERALRERGERRVTSAHAQRDPLEDDARAC